MIYRKDHSRFDKNRLVFFFLCMDVASFFFGGCCFLTSFQCHEMVRVKLPTGNASQAVSWSCQSLVFVDGSHSMSGGFGFFFGPWGWLDGWKRFSFLISKSWEIYIWRNCLKNSPNSSSDGFFFWVFFGRVPLGRSKPDSGGAMGTGALCLAMAVVYGGSWKKSQAGLR